jgi:hypothetical protein
MHRLRAYLRTHHIGLLALFIALGGTSYAATLPRNSVGATQLKKNAVTSAKVKNSSLLAKDFKAGQLPAGQAGPKGDPGAAGAKGDAGLNGTAGTARAYGRVTGTTFSRSKNVVSVTNPFPGDFCITLDASIDASRTGAIVTPDYSGDSTGTGGNGTQAWAEFRSGGGGPGACTASQIEILTGTRTATASGSPDSDVRLVTVSLINQAFFFAVP